jgi:hypothetical protein
MEKTEMAKHEFGIMNTPPKLNERYDSYDPEKYNCISVPDDCIEPLLDKLTQMESYWHTLEQPAKGLAYYGITLIPPSSMRLFTELLERASGTDELRDLLLRAQEEEKFVIHFGI